MPTQPLSTSTAIGGNDTVFLAGVFGIAATTALLWAGGVAAAMLTGHHRPRSAVVSGLRTLAHPGDPSRGWRTPMPGPVAYWTVTGLLLTLAATLATLVVWWWRRDTARRAADLHARDGLASRRDVSTHASRTALQQRAQVIRPTLHRPASTDVGYRVGTSRGVPVWTSAEDSVVILGPPRSGKGLHLVIPMLRDAPGPVITTSTRPDNIAATLEIRRQRGPVVVFDPQRLAPHLDAVSARWPLTRGCDAPQTAMIRAHALAMGSADQVDNRGFWQAQTEAALRAFLHAAAIGQRPAAEVYRWSLDPVAAGDAVTILSTTPGAAPGWADALEAIRHGDPRTRDNSWAGIRTALASLADPAVLATVSPDPDRELFEPAQFLAGTGTLYLLGTATGVNATSTLVAAFIEDIIDTARHTAATSPTVRLDPPLALILDEAANYTLPSLPALISEGGGTGITTIAVLQSLAQARARWGEHDGAAIWDAASIKIILGGGSNARDLHDLAALIGDIDQATDTINRDPTGRRSSSSSTRRVPILDTGQLRTLPFGTAVMLHRAAPPILLDLHPWTSPPSRRRGR